VLQQQQTDRRQYSSIASPQSLKALHALQVLTVPKDNTCMHSHSSSSSGGGIGGGGWGNGRAAQLEQQRQDTDGRRSTGMAHLCCTDLSSELLRLQKPTFVRPKLCASRGSWSQRVWHFLLARGGWLSCQRGLRRRQLFVVSERTCVSNTSWWAE
jgi:hypothetical protein